MMKINLSATAHRHIVILAVATLATHHRVVVLAHRHIVILTILTILTGHIVLAITTSVGHLIYP